jgi:hypothetical protein
MADQAEDAKPLEVNKEAAETSNKRAEATVDGKPNAAAVESTKKAESDDEETEDTESDEEEEEDDDDDDDDDEDEEDESEEEDEDESEVESKATTVTKVRSPEVPSKTMRPAGKSRSVPRHASTRDTAPVFRGFSF